jgi:hypothetical protein
MDDKEVSSNNVIIGVIVTVAIGLLISWITSSIYIQSYSYPSVFMIGGILFGLSKLALSVREEYDSRVMIGTIILIFTGGWLLSSHKVTNARYGAIFLGLVFLADIIYLVITKYSWKYEMNTMSWVINIIGDLILATMFFYSITQTN